MRVRVCAHANQVHLPVRARVCVRVCARVCARVCVRVEQVHLPLFGPLSQSFGFGNAGWCDWSDSRDGYTGWMGMGGSVMMWHRGEQIGFGYANNSMQAPGLPLDTHMRMHMYMVHMSMRMHMHMCRATDYVQSPGLP